MIKIPKFSKSQATVMKKWFTNYFKNDPTYPLDKTFTAIDAMVKRIDFYVQVNSYEKKADVYQKLTSFEALFNSPEDHKRTINFLSDRDYIDGNGYWIKKKELFVSIYKTLHRKKRFKPDVDISTDLIQQV